MEPKHSVANVRSQLSRIMNDKVGLTRNESDLTEAATSIKDLKAQFTEAGISNKSSGYNFEILHHHEVGFLLDTAETIVASATARKESRGAHYRSDFTEKDDQEWSKNVIVKHTESGLEVSYKNTSAG